MITNDAAHRELLEYINRNHPFPEMIVREQAEVVPEKQSWRDKMFTESGKFKYTCCLCEREYHSGQVKQWWIKPANTARKPVPHCPYCGVAGAITGWSVDWNKRREMAAKWVDEIKALDAVRKAAYAKYKQKLEAEEDEEDFESVDEPDERAVGTNRELFE